jgi:hypothetical protein
VKISCYNCEYGLIVKRKVLSGFVGEEEEVIQEKIHCDRFGCEILGYDTYGEVIECNKFSANE